MIGELKITIEINLFSSITNGIKEAIFEKKVGSISFGVINEEKINNNIPNEIDAIETDSWELKKYPINTPTTIKRNIAKNKMSPKLKRLLNKLTSRKKEAE